VWLGATGGETEAGSTVRQSAMQITQKNPDDFEQTAKDWKGQRKHYVRYFAVCPKDFSPKARSVK
jgi:hypothetical protein